MKSHRNNDEKLSNFTFSTASLLERIHSEFIPGKDGSILEKHVATHSSMISFSLSSLTRCCLAELQPAPMAKLYSRVPWRFPERGV